MGEGGGEKRKEVVSNYAVSVWEAPVKASVSDVSLLQLSPFFASIFPLFPRNA